ncbi:MAG: phosphonoacetaldehyde hydrolase [Anaerolineae bacterium]|nr:MAG: phosphonoacetaldehyde hydrolase [Anaerolineae bacterium]
MVGCVLSGGSQLVIVEALVQFTHRHSYRGPLRAVILDWAGTAVDYGSFAPLAVFLQLFEQRGIHITPADARAGMGRMKKDHLRAILERPAVAQAWQARYGTPPTPDQIDDLFQQFVPLQLSILKDYADPIPGLLETVAECRRRGLKIGSTTGYLRSMMDILAPAAAARGYRPDSLVCPDDVPAGRPAPWMCFQNAMNLGVYPMSAIVKVGDTPVDIEEGLNAGMWTVGVTLTGSLTGLTQAEVAALAPAAREALHDRAAEQLYQAGAHYVIQEIGEFPFILEQIQLCLNYGEQP